MKNENTYKTLEKLSVATLGAGPAARETSQGFLFYERRTGMAAKLVATAGKKTAKQLADEDKIDRNIVCVKGILGLIFVGLGGDIASIDREAVRMLILDAEDKLDEVSEFVYRV
jgi:hypothetical protein